MRAFTLLLEENDQLIRINESVDPANQIGAISRRYQNNGAMNRAVLFESIRGHNGFRLLTNGLGSYSRIALALGLPIKSKPDAICSTLHKRMQNPLKPIITKRSNNYTTLTGKDIDLNFLPVPKWHPKDAGKYLGTWHLNISQDPQSGIRNVGVYRMQVLSSNTTTVSISPDSHLRMHIERAVSQKRKIEMAVAIGVSEPIVMAAAAALPYGQDEFSIGGSWQEKPVELSPCFTIDIDAPSNSEIILEGFIHPDQRAKDGPFMDYAGIESINEKAFIYEVTSMSYRPDAIFRGTSVGLPGAEDHVLYSILSKLHLMDFHGSKIRNKIQSHLFSLRLYHFLQISGRIGKQYKKIENR